MNEKTVKMCKWCGESPALANKAGCQKCNNNEARRRDRDPTRKLYDQFCGVVARDR